MTGDDPARKALLCAVGILLIGALLDAVLPLDGWGWGIAGFITGILAGRTTSAVDNPLTRKNEEGWGNDETRALAWCGIGLVICAVIGDGLDVALHAIEGTEWGYFTALLAFHGFTGFITITAGLIMTRKGMSWEERVKGWVILAGGAGLVYVIYLIATLSMWDIVTGFFTSLPMMIVAVVVVVGGILVFPFVWLALRFAPIAHFFGWIFVDTLGIGKKKEKKDDPKAKAEELRELADALIERADEAEARADKAEARAGRPSATPVEKATAKRLRAKATTARRKADEAELAVSLSSKKR